MPTTVALFFCSSLFTSVAFYLLGIFEMDTICKTLPRPLGLGWRVECSSYSKFDFWHFLVEFGYSPHQLGKIYENIKNIHNFLELVVRRAILVRTLGTDQESTNPCFDCKRMIMLLAKFRMLSLGYLCREMRINTRPKMGALSVCNVFPMFVELVQLTIEIEKHNNISVWGGISR